MSDVTFVAGQAVLELGIAKNALNHLVQSIVMGELDCGTDRGMDAFVTFSRGIETCLDDIADSLESVVHENLTSDSSDADEALAG